MSAEGRLGQIVFEFFHKTTQLVALDRIPASTLAPFKPGKDKKGRSWFNLDVDESIGLSKILEPWRHDVLQPIVFEILLQRQAEAPEAVDEVVLERWVLQYEEHCVVGLGRPASDPAVSAREHVARQEAGVYKRMIVLLRSLCCMLPLLPAHRLCQEVVSKGHGACRVCLRVLDRTDAAAVASALFPGASASQQSRPKAFAAPQGPSTQGGAPMSHYQFQPIETQSGAVTVGLQYAQGLRLSLPKPVAAATGAAGRLIQDYMWSASPSAESPASSGAARACRGHSGAGAAWSRPHSAQMATSQQSQHSAHSSSAARHSHGHPAPHVPAHSHTAALPPHHPQSPGEAAHVHVHANAHANVHVHAHANTHGTGPGAGLPPRASPPAYRSSPRAWAQHPLQDAAAPPAPANNRPAQIQRGFEFQPGTTRGAAGGAAATQPTARSSLSAGDLRNLHPGRSSGEAAPGSAAGADPAPAGACAASPVRDVCPDGGRHPASAPSAGGAGWAPSTGALGAQLRPPEGWGAHGTGAGQHVVEEMRGGEAASLGHSSLMSSSPAVPHRVSGAAGHSPASQGVPRGIPGTPGAAAMDIAASWGAPGSTPRYAYSPQCFTGPPGTSPHLGSMLRLPSFGRGSSSRDTPSARRRQGTLSREPSVHSVAEAGGGASPGGPAGAGRRAGAADVDTDMPFALDESSHAAPGAPASPGSGAGAMVGAEGRVSVAAAAASPGSGRRGAGREPASAREVSVLLRMFQEAPVIGKSSGPPMGEAMREVERYRQLASMPPVEPSAQVTALLRGCEVTEGATQAVGPAGEAEGDGGCRERAEGDVTMGASGDSVAGKAGDASVEGPVLEW